MWVFFSWIYSQYGGCLSLLYANRLLEKLVQKEKEYQTLLQRSLEQKTQELHLLQLRLKPGGMRRY